MAIAADGTDLDTLRREFAEPPREGGAARAPAVPPRPEVVEQEVGEDRDRDAEEVGRPLAPGLLEGEEEPVVGRPGAEQIHRDAAGTDDAELDEAALLLGEQATDQL